MLYIIALLWSIGFSFVEAQVLYKLYQWFGESILPGLSLSHVYGLNVFLSYITYKIAPEEELTKERLIYHISIQITAALIFLIMGYITYLIMVS